MRLPEILHFAERYLREPRGRHGSAVIGVVDRKETRLDEAADLAVRSIVELLIELVFDDAALRFERVGVDVVEEIGHPIALQPERELELTRGDGLAVDGVLDARLALDIGRSDALEVPEEHVLADVTRALEHEVLEEMRQAVEMRRVVLRADPVGEAQGDDREAIVRIEHDLEPVGQGVALERGSEGDARPLPIRKHAWRPSAMAAAEQRRASPKSRRPRAIRWDGQRSASRSSAPGGVAGFSAEDGLGELARYVPSDELFVSSYGRAGDEHDGQVVLFALGRPRDELHGGFVARHVELGERDLFGGERFFDTAQQTHVAVFLEVDDHRRRFTQDGAGFAAGAELLEPFLRGFPLGQIGGRCKAGSRRTCSRGAR